MKIGFNKPYHTGKEIRYIANAINREHISGNGYYTRMCQQFFEGYYGYRKVLFTNSCTDALEMAALLLDVQPGDEVIVPSYTFTSTANAFILRGAKIIFADSEAQHPNMDIEKLKTLITSRTKVIVPVHYGGASCDMDKLMELAKKLGIYVVEDAAQGIDSRYKGKALGSIGHFGAISFHDSKNITSGEGGLLVINDEKFIKRAEIIWEKGTNRAAFFRGDVNRYCWKDLGSSFLGSELNAAYLFAQTEELENISKKRRSDWNYYYENLSVLGERLLPQIPAYTQHNGHIFYLTCENADQRKKLEEQLNADGIQAIGHYHALHQSEYGKPMHDGRPLPNADKFASCILRLPLFYTLSLEEKEFIVSNVLNYFKVAKATNPVGTMEMGNGKWSMAV